MFILSNRNFTNHKPQHDHDHDHDDVQILTSSVTVQQSFVSTCPVQYNEKNYDPLIKTLSCSINVQVTFHKFYPPIPTKYTPYYKLSMKKKKTKILIHFENVNFPWKGYNRLDKWNHELVHFYFTMK